MQEQYTTKRRKWPYIVGAVVIFGVGISAGAATAEPETRTETKTVAADPEIITKTETETVTEEVTPQACLDAIESANDMRHDAAKMADLSVQLTDVNLQWPHLVIKAAKSGMNMDVAGIQEITTTIEGMTADVQGVNGDLDDLTARTESHVADFQVASRACKASP